MLAASASRTATARGAATRQALLDSAVTLIATTGYAATSTQAVLDHSGISRGSLLHHYPTRQHLMIAVAAEAIGRRVRAVETALSSEPEPIQALRRFPDVQWQVENDIPARALAEILLAARWDAELEADLRPMILLWNRRLGDRIRHAAVAAGLDNGDELAVEVSVLVAATRGLSTMTNLLADEETVPRTRATLRARYDACLARGRRHDRDSSPVEHQPD